MWIRAWRATAGYSHAVNEIIAAPTNLMVSVGYKQFTVRVIDLLDGAIARSAGGWE
ncbi:MAG: hypothetical protein LBD79_00980 [Treponema sp.]|nr:hypothetical protein [Treponema sp.]